jgi:NAD(P)-dependent dehydrogenase (short-subunit alcohol dehydrogenase family)
MKETGGSIVNISSLAARCGTVGRSTLYGPLKSAVIGLSTTFAGEYAAYGIRVNTVLPGFTVTPKVRETIPAKELEFNKEGTLLHRIGEPEDIAKPVVFLCSDAAGYITAASLEVSGGRSVVLNPSYSYEQKTNK